MPWSPEDAMRHTKKATTPKKQRQFAHVANSVLEATGDEGRAIREANAVVGGTAHHGKKKAKKKSRAHRGKRTLAHAARPRAMY